MQIPELNSKDSLIHAAILAYAAGEITIETCLDCIKQLLGYPESIEATKGREPKATKCQQSIG